MTGFFAAPLRERVVAWTPGRVASPPKKVLPKNNKKVQKKKKLLKNDKMAIIDDFIFLITLVKFKFKI